MFIVIFLVSSLLPVVWLGCHVLARRGWPLMPRLFLIALMLVISQMMTINERFFGSIASPDMPAPLLEAQAAAFTAQALCFLIVFCWDVFRLLRWLWRRAAANLARDKTAAPFPGRIGGGPAPSRTKAPADPGRRAFLKRGAASTGLFLAAPAASLATSCHGVSNGTALPIVNTMERALEGLDPALDGLRILHMTDIHVGTLTSVAWMRETVRRANDSAPDLICITGDISDGLLGWASPEGATRVQVAMELAKLSAPLGVWGCAGNHEFYSDYANWMRVYDQVGIRLLRDQAVLIEHRGGRLVLAGRDDQVAHERFGRPAVPVRKVFAGMPEPGACARVMLDHRPTRAEQNAAAGCRLQLSGHTHGGQCPGLERGVARANKGRVRGWYTVQGMPLYVSSGVGLWSGFPLRLTIPAEMALITLRAAR